jgi:hypothetical protein
MSGHVSAAAWPLHYPELQTTTSFIQNFIKEKTKRKK